MTSKKATHHTNGILIKNFPGYFLIACLVAALFFVYRLLEPFLFSLILAAILATVFYPLYQKFLNLVKNRARLAALLTCLFIFVLVLIPLIFFIRMLSLQAVETYVFIEQKIHSGALDAYLYWQKGNIFYDLFDAREGRLNAFIDLQGFDLKQNLIEVAFSIRSFLVTQIGSILKGFGKFLFGIVILFFAMYYFFKDAELIGEKLMKLSPLAQHHEIKLFKKFKDISKIAMVSIFLKAIVQGLVSGIGFGLVGIPGAVFWGTMTGFMSVIPFIGTSLIWIPASILLFLNGQFSSGIFFFLWNLILTSNIDNLVCSLFIGKTARINPLIAFLSIFGGISIFGLPGLIFGPLILAIFFTLLHIYEIEYRHVLDDPSP